MKITSIDVYDCNVRSKDPTSGSNPILIRVNTDEGLTGLGEVGLAYGAGYNAAMGMIKDFAPFVIGKDPMKVEEIWENMYRATFWGMSGGPVFYGGMSAYDIALWDIRGKALNAPIYHLLGGKTNNPLRT